MQFQPLSMPEIWKQLRSPDVVARFAQMRSEFLSAKGSAGEQLSWMLSQALPEIMQGERAGAADAAAMSLIGAGLTATSPWLNMAGLGANASLLPFGLGAAGSAWLVNRMFAEVEQHSYLPSALEITSAMPPKLGPAGGLLIGYTCDGGKPIVIPYEMFTRHFMTGGMTGVGKTVSAVLFMAQQISKGGGVLWVDGKLDPGNILMFYHLAKWMGREHDIRVINPGDPANSNTYNFILYGDADEVASRILSTIPSTQSSAGADYYKQASNQGLVSLVATIKALGLAYNCMDLAILLTNEKAMLDLEKRVDGMSGKYNSNVALFKLFLESCKTRNNQTGAISIDLKKLRDTFGGVAGRLFVYGVDKMGEITSSYSPDVRLFEDIRDSRLIYVALPTMGKQLAAQNFGKIVTGDLRSAIAQVQSLPPYARPNPPFLVWLDEVASYGSAEALETPLQQARSANVFIGLGYQENSSIEALGPAFLGSIVGNTYSKLFFKPANRETADCWADLIGKHKVAIDSLSRTLGGGTSAAALRVTPDSMASSNAGVAKQSKLQEEYRISAEKLARLDFGQAVLLYGASSVYDIRVPKLDFSPSLQRELGGLSIQRPRRAVHSAVNGLDYFKRYEDFISDLSMSADVRREQERDTREMARTKFSGAQKLRAEEQLNLNVSQPQPGQGQSAVGSDQSVL